MELSHNALANRLTKERLFEATKIFSGQPHRYRVWVTELHQRTEGLDLTAADILRLLKADTTGAPNKLIENVIDSSGHDSARTLNVLWMKLYERFGAPMHVLNSIEKMVKNLAPARYPNQNHLDEVLQVCSIIELNMGNIEELKHFNSATGLQQIWLKLPDIIRSHWQKYVHDHRKRHCGQHPTMHAFNEFLEDQVKACCDPIYQNSMSSMREESSYPIKKENIVSGIISKERFAPQEMNASKGSSEPRSCILHMNDDHSTETCREFAAKDYSTKCSLVRRHGLCYSCLGKHLVKNCDSSSKCSKCPEKHTTAMH